MIQNQVLRQGLHAVMILILVSLPALGEETARGYAEEDCTKVAVNSSPDQSEDLVSLEAEIDRQCQLLEEKQICDITDPNSLPYCIKFLDDYETQLRDQALMLESFEELIAEQWPNLSDQERIDLTVSLEDLLRRQSILLFRFQSYMKILWCLLDQEDKKKFLDSFEDLLKRQSKLLLGFEDLLHRQQMIEGPIMADFLSSFEDLIRRQAVSLDKFSDFFKVNCHALEIRKSVQPPCACVRPGQQVTYHYTITNNANYTIKCIKIIDDHLGVIAEGLTLRPHEIKSFSKSTVIDEPVGYTVCNQARVYGIDPKGFTIFSQSSRICVRVSAAAANADSITTGRQKSLALASDPASASNSIEIKKNQKSKCLQERDTADRERIRIADQFAGAFNNAKASNSIKIHSNHK